MTLKAQKFFSHKITTMLVSLFAALSPLFFYAARSSSHVFLDTALFTGFSQLLFWLMLINAVFATVVAAMRWRTAAFQLQQPKWLSALGCAAFAFTVLFVIVDVCMMGVMGEESIGVLWRSMAELLPFALAYLIAAMLAFFFPSVTNRKVRIAIAVIIIIIAVLALLFMLYPPVYFDFLSDPMVIDNGESYSVVFATSAAGTGYIEYEYGGTTYKLYDEVSGRLRGSSTIHSITVPYEHLNNNTYRVGSMRVFEEYAYGGRNGRTITSGEYTFTPCTGEDVTLLCVSDWHTRTAKAKEAVSHMGEYDAVLMMGDAAPGLQYEAEAAEYIVKFGGDISGGSIPIIYTRGNHETRGKYASELSEALKMDKYYYETSFGDYRFIVLDSAEDKEDSHPEYGGMVNYENYRRQMIEWLEGLESTGQKTIALCHAPELCREEELADRGFAKLEELGASVLISGHLHSCYLDRESESFPVYVDGGHGGGDYIASKVTLSADGIRLFACNTDGDTVLDEFVEWK